ncbi:MAG: tetratricopeptide repeat protein [Pseudomonadales bacterium]
MNTRHLLSVAALAGCLIFNPANANTLAQAKADVQAENYSSALKILTPLAKSGNADASNLLGQMYQNGWGVPASIGTAKSYYKKGARSGHIDSVNSLRALDDIEYRKELVKVKEKAATGNATAQNRYGEMLEYGFGVKRDPRAAFEQYQLAAAQNFVAAQHNVGRSYNFGTGINQDFAEAEKWYRIAAQKGYTQSMFYLGTLYATAHGQDESTDQDITAYAWMSNAAALGDSTAKTIENRLLMKLEESQMGEAKALSEDFKKTYVTPFK